jgi:hypothetical protein
MVDGCMTRANNEIAMIVKTRTYLKIIDSLPGIAIILAQKCR